MKRMGHRQLRWIRENQGLSREEFAKKLKIDISTYNNFENGAAPIPVHIERVVVRAVKKTR